MEAVRAPTREQQIVDLRDRDGDFCLYPDCFKIIDFKIIGGPWEATIDHWHPKSAGGGESLDNKKLMHRKCNQLKGDLIPNADGSLPKRRVSTFQRRAEKRAGREDVCGTCISGRILLFGETCPDCGSGPQPELFPTAYKVQPKDCPHAGMQWCWACTGIGLYEREPASKTVFDGDFLDE